MVGPMPEVPGALIGWFLVSFFLPDLFAYPLRDPFGIWPSQGSSVTQADFIRSHLQGCVHLLLHEPGIADLIRFGNCYLSPIGSGIL